MSEDPARFESNRLALRTLTASSLGPGPIPSPPAGTLLIDGQRIHFQPQERFLFMALWNARGVEVRHDALMDAMSAWGHVGVVAARVYEVRRKLVRTRFRIELSWGRGYRLVRIPARSGSALETGEAEHEQRV